MWLSVLTAVKKLCAGIGHCERRHKPFTLGSQQVLNVHVDHKCALVFCLGVCHLLACDNPVSGIREKAIALVVFPVEGRDQTSRIYLPARPLAIAVSSYNTASGAYHRLYDLPEGRKRPASAVGNSASHPTNGQKAASASMAAQVAMLLASLLTFTFLVAIDATSIVLAVSTITADLGGNATESFWVGASYLLSMCLSQPIVSRLSNVFLQKSLVLASIMMLGIGSLLCESADGVLLLLTGRTVQGLGAGGLMVLSYAVCGDMNKQSKGGSGSGSGSGPKFLAAISLFVAAGTICGPFIGAALSDNHHWRWIFRLNIPMCVVLGVLVYNGSDVSSRDTSAAEPGVPARNSSDIPNADSPRAKLSDLDFVGIVLFLTSVAPLLVGLSLAGSLYRWTQWQVIAPVATGGVFLLLLIVKELCPASVPFPLGSRNAFQKPLLGLRLLKGRQSIVALGGAFWLGLLMYALLFFLPIYYRVVKERSAIATGVFLLPQTLMMAPCAGVVLVLVQLLRLHYSCAVLLGWFCTAVGMGLLALLGAERSAASDVSLNLLSGFGIGVLLPALALSAQEGKKGTDVREALMVFIFMRYLGSASGLVIVGLVFQRVLRSNLGSTKFRSEADNMTKYATTLMYSIREMSSPEDKQILIHVTETALRTIWLALSLVSLAMFLLSCVAFVVGREEQGRESQVTGPSADSAPKLDLTGIFKKSEISVNSRNLEEPEDSEDSDRSEKDESFLSSVKF
ncbi:hypothetical protein AA0121_g12812 [Alternaria tenuissima]|nr:hypothetical protein AA0121_g12812 [Alternaria tenuissima]